MLNIGIVGLGFMGMISLLNASLTATTFRSIAGEMAATS